MPPKYLKLRSSPSADLINQLNDPKYIEYEVISIVASGPETDTAYLRINPTAYGEIKNYEEFKTHPVAAPTTKGKSKNVK